MAITASQTVDRRLGDEYQFPVAASTTLYAGGFAALDSNHRLVMATDAANRRVVGIVFGEVDNSTGAAADLNGVVETGVFKVTNSATNAVTSAHLGLVCWIEDNSTVASVVGTNSVVAGIVCQVDTDGVWVAIGLPTSTPPPVAVTLTSTNGTAGAAADLTALKAEAEKIGDDVRAIHAALVTRGLLK